MTLRNSLRATSGHRLEDPVWDLPHTSPHDVSGAAHGSHVSNGTSWAVVSRAGSRQWQRPAGYTAAWLSRGEQERQCQVQI